MAWRGTPSLSPLFCPSTRRKPTDQASFKGRPKSLFSLPPHFFLPLEIRYYLDPLLLRPKGRESFWFSSCRFESWAFEFQVSLSAVKRFFPLEKPFFPKVRKTLLLSLLIGTWKIHFFSPTFPKCQFSHFPPSVCFFLPGVPPLFTSPLPAASAVRYSKTNLFFFPILKLCPLPDRALDVSLPSRTRFFFRTAFRPPPPSFFPSWFSVGVWNSSPSPPEKDWSSFPRHAEWRAMGVLTHQVGPLNSCRLPWEPFSLFPLPGLWPFFFFFFFSSNFRLGPWLSPFR